MMYQTVVTGSHRCSDDYNWLKKLGNWHDQRVEKLITTGWRPLGGVSYAENNGYAVLAQAMVKEE